MKCLQDFSFKELEELVVSLGQPKFRATQLYDLAMRHKEYDEATNIPKGLIDSLKDKYFATSLKIIERLVGKDGTEKYLYALNDGNVVEGVFMPHRYGNTLCVSTQVGCRMGCAFCASGLGGLIRNLTAGEILGQVLCVNRLHGGTPKDRAITNVVLMGSGEPLDNYEEVTKFLELLSYEKGINISLRNVSLSTSGLVPKIKELAESNLPVVLTISLHAATDEKRSALMPVNKAYPIKELIAAAKYYFEKTHRRVIFEYALVEGKNSDKKSAEELAHLLKGFPCHVNLINLNYVKEKGLRGIKGNYIKEFIDNLNKMGISATLRHSMGNDIDGACGQLRVKYLAEHDEVSRRGYED
ncbi:MAG: 23S rRNA (adenine(2503)-C(2))-methyltransferase RlmN [Clostridia bacterium]|nr:23S rRNA (adenine(2503)-C(2))-methyltransferase RlmN [Clostridia bacterium]